MDSFADVQLIGKALASGWLDNFEDRKRKAVHDLFDIVENSPKDMLRIEAFKALVRAGDADRKRQELAIKSQAFDEARRLRLLELIKHIPSGTLAEIASRHADFVSGGRTDEGPGTESQSEGV